jgi:segregation and condensation protein B
MTSDTATLPIPSLKQIVEALLFVSSEPIPLQKLRDAVAAYHPVTPNALRDALTELASDYEREERSFLLEEIAHGYALRTRALFAPYLDVLCGERRSDRLSPAATEVLAIIAYRQPITRPQVEALRGVDCSGVIHTLLERGLIAPAGKLEAPGRPTLFATTKVFLSHYGLRDIADLPPLASLEE